MCYLLHIFEILLTLFGQFFRILSFTRRIHFSLVKNLFGYYNCNNQFISSSSLWVYECPPWCSIVGATVTVHQFFCILHYMSNTAKLLVLGTAKSTKTKTAKTEKKREKLWKINSIGCQTLSFRSSIFFQLHCE